MQLREFIGHVEGFDKLQHPEKIKLFAWYLHTQQGKEFFSNGDIRLCYTAINSAVPDVTVYLPRLANKRPPELLKHSKGYSLEGKIRRALDAKYGDHPTTVAVKKSLSDLAAKMPTLAEQVFYQETLSCYKIGAFRAAIVMAWNLAYSHLLHRILADQQRLAAFNAAIPRRYPKRSGIVVVNLDDFSKEFKESEIIEVCKTASLFSSDIAKILTHKLDRRNTAAHPSSVKVVQSQADDVITDLVNNVVLLLTV
jgi:hypothetical protein